MYLLFLRHLLSLVLHLRLRPPRQVPLELADVRALDRDLLVSGAAPAGAFAGAPRMAANGLALEAARVLPAYGSDPGPLDEERVFLAHLWEDGHVTAFEAVLDPLGGRVRRAGLAGRSPPGGDRWARLSQERAFDLHVGLRLARLHELPAATDDGAEVWGDVWWLARMTAADAAGRRRHDVLRRADPEGPERELLAWVRRQLLAGLTEAPAATPSASLVRTPPARAA